jgi:SPP1 family predicted phage head-tail adaptor
MDMLVTIQQYSTALNANREQIKTWETLKTCYSERVRRPGGESIQANQDLATMPVEYRIRHDAQVTPTMRLCEGALTGSSVFYYITNVQHWKREGYSLIQAERRDNA